MSLLYDCPIVNKIIREVANDFDLANDENIIRPGNIIINTTFTEGWKTEIAKTEYASVIWCTVLKGILKAKGIDKTLSY